MEVNCQTLFINVDSQIMLFDKMKSSLLVTTSQFGLERCKNLLAGNPRRSDRGNDWPWGGLCAVEGKHRHLWHGRANGSLPPTYHILSGHPQQLCEGHEVPAQVLQQGSRVGRSKFVNVPLQGLLHLLEVCVSLLWSKVLLCCDSVLDTTMYTDVVSWHSYVHWIRYSLLTQLWTLSKM